MQALQEKDVDALIGLTKAPYTKETVARLKAKARQIINSSSSATEVERAERLMTRLIANEQPDGSVIERAVYAGQP